MVSLVILVCNEDNPWGPDFSNHDKSTECVAIIWAKFKFEVGIDR